jgi:ubiquinone/menaquinone biosynthesis C-methylase UbiE
VRDLLFRSFPHAVPAAGADVLEIGGGVGWIMQAMDAYLSRRGVPPRRIVDLDIAPNMLAKAKQRLGTGAPYEFLLYDGITIPLPEQSIDLIYSVSSLQHIPRPFVYNLFFEVKRLLRGNGFALLHFLSTDALAAQENLQSWRTEINYQIKGIEAHWHHFYTQKELVGVLKATGFSYVFVSDDGRGALVACVSSQTRGGASRRLSPSGRSFCGSRSLVNGLIARLIRSR